MYHKHTNTYMQLKSAIINELMHIMSLFIASRETVDGLVTLKTRSFHDANVVVIGGTARCHNNNSQFSQQLAIFR